MLRPGMWTGGSLRLIGFERLPIGYEKALFLGGRHYYGIQSRLLFDDLSDVTPSCSNSVAQ